MYTKRLAVLMVSFLLGLVGSEVLGATATTHAATPHAKSALSASKNPTLKQSVASVTKSSLTAGTTSTTAAVGTQPASTAPVVATSAVAAKATTPEAKLQEFKPQPRVNLRAYSGSKTLGEGQVLLPIYGDASEALYGLVEGNIVVNDNSWLAGGGLGYRQVRDNAWIFGGYALFDYNNTTYNSGFWVFNPGLEMLAQQWDVTVNGYFPLHATKRMGDVRWAYDMLDVKEINALDYIRFTGHDECAHQFQIAEEAGRGFSVEVGHVIPHFTKAKMHLAGYYFDTKDFGSTNGVAGRLTYDLSKYVGLELRHTYDRVYHHQTLLGLKFTLGGYSEEQKQNFGIASRLTDPIEHNFVHANGSSQVFIQRKYDDRGEFKVHDNLWFFKPTTEPAAVTTASDNVEAVGAAAGDGTYENPFVGVTPDNYALITPTIGTIDKYPLLYFAPGTYSFRYFTSQVGPGRFDLPNGWGMYGRTTDYNEAAQGDNRALFEGGLDLNYASATAGQASNVLNSIRVHNNMNSYLGHVESSALYANQASNVLLQDVDFMSVANSSSESMIAYGMYANNNSSIIFNGGTNNVFGTASTSASFGAADGYGIYTANGSGITFNGGANNVSGIAMNSAGVTGCGISANNGASVIFNDGTNTVSGVGSNGYSVVAYGYGIDAYGSRVVFNNGINTISGTSTSPSNSIALGIFATDSDLIFANPMDRKVTIIANGANFQYGIKADSSSSINRTAADISQYAVFQTSNPNVGYAVNWADIWTLPW